MTGNALSQGQIVSLAMIVAGSAGLLVIGAWHARAVRAMAATRTRSALVGASLITAGLALLFVRRLDPAALSRVFAGATAALLTAERTRQAAPHHLRGLRGHRVLERRRSILAPAQRKELQ